MKLKGNYVFWSSLHILAGIMVFALGMLTGIEYYIILAIFLLPLVGYKLWFEKSYKPDERETQILAKVYAHSGSSTVFLLYCAHNLIMGNFEVVLWGLYLFLRGAFGLYYFTRS